MSSNIPESADVANLPDVQGESPVIQRIRTWMQSFGVGLEMQVAGAFRKKLPHGQFMSSVEHSRTYTGFDASSGIHKIRETDVVVKLTRMVMGDVWITSWIIVECKSSKKAPWVLYYDSAQLPNVPGTPFNNLWQIRQHDDLNLHNILGSDQSSLLSSYGTATCYSTSSARDSGADGNQKNDARDAMLQVWSATKGIMNFAFLTDGFNQFHIFIPVIVTAADLCSITLQLNGETTISEISRGLFLGQMEDVSQDPKGTWIVQANHLEEFVDEIINDLHGLDYRTH